LDSLFGILRGPIRFAALFLVPRPT